jgi:formylglycine-generating enzyme required for sulfatase activity
MGRGWSALAPPLLFAAAASAAVSGATARGDADAGGGYATIPGGTFRSVLRYEDGGGKVAVAPFALMRRPVTNAEFLAFVRAHPEWQRGRVAPVFAESRYLQSWAGPLAPGARVRARQPVVDVSWFAASAYCEAQGARLPTWAEWEYVAAADDTRRDARSDPAWRERILGWYSRPSNAPLADVAAGRANAYGVHDMHGLVWEWTEDYASMLVSADARDAKNQDRLKFCGAGSIGMDDVENYAVLMRVAMLSSLEGANITSNLGFRCAKPLPKAIP